MTFVVVRTYSHTDRRCLWAVQSRPFARRAEADHWKTFVEKEWNTLHPNSDSSFFVVQVFEEPK